MFTETEINDEIKNRLEVYDLLRTYKFTILEALGDASEDGDYKANFLVGKLSGLNFFD